jgi:quercetin 2,3-dioxygenase
MPSQNSDGSPIVGVQLWVDLPQSLKYCDPRYRDLRASEIPTDTSKDGKVTIKVIAGKTHSGVISQQNLSYTPVWYFDVTVKPGGKLIQPIPRNWSTFAFVFQGSAVFGKDKAATKIDQYTMTVFEKSGDRVVSEVPEDATEDARFILVAGPPLDQEIVQYGPFVATSAEGIYKAMSDYQSFSNGFEKAKSWQSEIGKRLMY